MDYDLAESETAAELSVIVRRAIKEGWEPHGSACVASYLYTNERENYSETRFVYTQALIKK